jgi:shikimate kinase
VHELKKPGYAGLFKLQNKMSTVIFSYNSTMYPINTIQPKRLSGNIFLVGMMGAGKTTVGKLLAQQLGKIFVDSDEEIQQRTGVTIPHIFDVEGEAGFRQREASVIQDLVLLDNIVLATGGGSVLDENSRVALCCNGVVVYLKSTIHDLWQRTRHDRNRPLLQTADPHSRLKNIYEQRDPLYAQVANLVISTGKQSAQNLVLHLQQELNRFSKTT